MTLPVWVEEYLIGGVFFLAEEVGGKLSFGLELFDKI